MTASFDLRQSAIAKLAHGKRLTKADKALLQETFGVSMETIWQRVARFEEKRLMEEARGKRK